MRRKIYSDEEKAKVRFVLASNDGNLAKTARDTGISRDTIKSWNKIWLEEGTPEKYAKLEENYLNNYVADAERVRNLALKELELMIRKDDVKFRDLIVAFGILEDKITRAKGLATNRIETVVQMPDLKELGTQLGSFIQEALEAAKDRRREIVEVDSDIVVKKALTKGEQA